PGQKKSYMTAVWNYREGTYEAFFKGSKKMYDLPVDESPAVTERLEAVVDSVQKSLPGVFALTNQLAVVLSNTTSLTSNLNEFALSARPLATNLNAATAHLDHPGALGEWLLPTNITLQLETTLGNANATVINVNTNLVSVIQDIGRSL